MSANVFLAPCDAGNFDRTVRSEIDLNEYPDRPAELSAMEEVRFWGARKGASNESYFGRMKYGDLVLFYQNGKYVGTGWVEMTFEDDDQWASRTFWHNAPSKLIYTIEDFTPETVPKTAVNRIFDYAAGYYPQGLIRVAEEKLDRRPKVIKLALKKYTEQYESGDRND